MELQGPDLPREFSALNADEKIQAVLGVVMKSISKHFAIDLSGINYEEMEDEQRAKIDSVFTQEGIETTEESGSIKYRLSDEEREKLSKSVDMKTVHGAIANKLWGELELDDILKK